jgi:hypothetical protein
VPLRQWLLMREFVARGCDQVRSLVGEITILQRARLNMMDGL